MRILLLVTVLTSILNYSMPANCETLEIVMDYYPPFSYEENGEIKGISTQIVKAVLKDAGLKARIKQYPFKRAYTMTQKRKNVFEYCVVKTTERTPLFKWVGIVGPAEQVLFASKNKNIKIDKFEDLKNYTIGTTFEDVVDQFLSSRKETFDLKLERIASYKNNMSKLMKGRLDLWGGNKFVGYQLARKIGFNENDIKVAYTINELTDYYYLVTGLQTSDKLVKKLSESFEKINKNGTYQKIYDEYFK